MKVSVVIPVYNVENYLSRCLDSVLTAAERLTCEKTDCSVEILAVNDGSTDGSTAILARYADRVRVLNKPNGGLGSARNAGLEAMTGDYVTFVDSDDVIPPEALLAFATVAEASGAALVVSSDFAKNEVPPPLTFPVKWCLRPTKWMVGRRVQDSACNKLYRADLFRTRRYPDTLYEDFPVTTAILAEVGSFAVIDAPLYVYCVPSGAMSIVHSAFSERKMRDSLTVVGMVLAERTGGPQDGFLLHQASDGLSSTVGQVYKSNDASIIRAFLPLADALLAEHPEVTLTLKARLRLWILRRSATA